MYDVFWVDDDDFLCVVAHHMCEFPYSQIHDRMLVGNLFYWVDSLYVNVSTMDGIHAFCHMNGKTKRGGIQLVSVLLYAHIYIHTHLD